MNYWAGVQIAVRLCDSICIRGVYRDILLLSVRSVYSIWRFLIRL